MAKLGTTEVLLQKAEFELKAYLLRAEGKIEGVEGRNKTASPENMAAANSVLTNVGNMLEELRKKQGTIFDKDFFSDTPEKLVAKKPTARAFDVVDEYFNSKLLDENDELALKSITSKDILTSPSDAIDATEYKDFSDFSRAITVKKDEIKGNIGELKALRKEIEQQSKKINTGGGLLGKPSEVKDIFDKLQAEINAEIVRYQGESKALDKSKTARQEKEIAVEKSVNEANKKIAGLEKDVSTLTKKVTDIEAQNLNQNQNLVKELTSAKNDLEAKQKELNDYQASVKDKLEKAAKTETLRSSQEKKVEEVQKVAEQLTTNVSAVNAEVASQQRSKKEQTELHGQDIKKYQDLIKSADTVIAELKQDNQKLKMENTGLQSELKSARQLISNMFSYFAAAVSKVLGMDTGKKVADTVSAEISSKHTGAQNAILKAENEEVPGFKAEIESLQKEVTGLKQDKTKLEKENSDLLKDKILSAKEQQEQQMKKPESIWSKLTGGPKT